MSKKENLINQRFGRLQVIEPCENINGRTAWLCQCDCGKKVKIISKSLKNGNTKSCGCLHKELVSKQFSKDITNQRFGNLVAISPTSERRHGSIVWKCQCDCGSEHYTTTEQLLAGHCISCGCIKSKGENKIKKILQDNKILFTQQFPVKIESSQYFFDFAIYDEDANVKYIIEYEGQHHYKSNNRGWHTQDYLKLVQTRDKIKNKWCEQHNIPIIRIPYWEYEKITFEYLQERMKEQNV